MPIVLPRRSRRTSIVAPPRLAVALGLLATALSLLSVAARAQTSSFNDGDSGPTAAAEVEAAFPIWQWSGYGQFDYRRFDFYENAQDTTPEARGELDLRRVVLEPVVRISPRLRFVAEIEFEHGGTGSTVEYEPEEAGEFEIEVERGGEVILENAFLEYLSAPTQRWRVGEMTVPFGMVNRYHRPDQHFTIERSLAETALIPSTWHDIGVAYDRVAGRTQFTVMLVRALDSSLFTGYDFVAGGSAQRLESRRADDFALVLAAEHTFAPGAIIGAALYHGNSGGNRARSNLQVDAPLTLAELHGRWERGPFTLRGQFMIGRLEDSASVTQANFNTFNAGELGVSRTPVGSEAESFFVEAGYDFFASRAGRSDSLVAFARYDAFDTHAGVATGITRNPRYDRQAVTVGLNYSPARELLFKAEFSRRENAGTTANEQDIFGLAVAFRF
ncbi:MAG: hypothetical protein R3E87_20745 [Burkholderiaceae bacterium]